jgi:dipeptidyl aminopeptidase/acylaminoacyl peptidase
MLDDINALNGLFYLDDLVTPMILHHGTQDTSVPSVWSVNLHAKLNELGKESTLHLYEGNDHELSLKNEHLTALERDVIFFSKHMSPRKF